MPSEGPGCYRTPNQGRYQTLKKQLLGNEAARERTSEPREADRTPALTVHCTQVFSNVPCQLKCPGGTKVTRCPTTCLFLPRNSYCRCNNHKGTGQGHDEKCMVSTVMPTGPRTATVFHTGHYLCRRTVKLARAPPWVPILNKFPGHGIGSGVLFLITIV